MTGGSCREAWSGSSIREVTGQLVEVSARDMDGCWWWWRVDADICQR